MGFISLLILIVSVSMVVGTFIISFSNSLADQGETMKLRVDAETDLDAEFGDYLEAGGVRAEDMMTYEIFDERLQTFTKLDGRMPLRKVLDNYPGKHRRVSLTMKRDEGAKGVDHLAINGKAFRLEDRFMPLTITDDGTTVELRIPEVDNIERDDLDGRTGLSTWDASICLAQYLSLPVNRKSIVEGKKVIELGAGTGVAGLSAAFLGARSVQLTDLNYATANLRQNVEINTRTNPSIKVKVDVGVLDWTDSGTWPTGPVDVILAADVAWLNHLVAPLASTIKGVLARNPEAELYLAHQTRSTSVDKALFDSLRKDLSVTEIDRALYHQEFSSEKIKIFRVVVVMNT
jgi:predicted nicotinamide N-methyase